MAKESKGHPLKKLLPAALITTAFFMSFYTESAKAASLDERSITLSSVTAGAIANHKFQFNLAGSGSLGSIAFQYCEDPLISDPCVAPGGMDASGADLDTQTGQTGFSVHPNTVSNRIVISRPVALSAPGTLSYDFSNILNPDTPNHTTYVRITTYSNIDATGTHVDDGVVAFSLAPSLGVNVFVPPYLTFCVGITVGPKCQTATGLNIDMGTLEANRTAFTTTQFAGATNDNTGYSVSILGTTMTSGNNTIDRLSSSQTSQTGTAQFGINLRNNSNPDTGRNPEGGGSLTPAPAYNSPNLFKFDPGDVISSTTSATEFNRMTVSYIMNINAGQPPGIYSTTLTYVAVASF
ncbi:MAG TPA: hypothetical protein VFX86_02900 [Candidatus Saccharimonadales bacterium]|nr:hypothetical protein [Candidatus Saccharimonadales bacterium]